LKECTPHGGSKVQAIPSEGRQSTTICVGQSKLLTQI
jgi:hypothetical protein